MGRTVVIFAAGSRGDLQPAVALGRGLTHRGDSVRIIASKRYEHLVIGAGLEFFPLSLDPAEIASSPEGQELLAGGRNPVKFARNLRRIGRPLAHRLLAEVQAGTDGCDLMIAPTLGFLGVHIGELLGIPHAIIHFQPSQPTGAFPHPFLPQARYLGSYANRASFELIDQVAWQLSRPFINPWRRDDLRLPKVPLRGPMGRARGSTVLCGFSSAVVPRPQDWPENVHVTGYWFLDQPDWKPSEELAAFLAAGPPPVYVGFGSMVPEDPEETGRTIRAALRSEGLRGVLAGVQVGGQGPHGRDPGTSEDDMIVVQDVPHSRLFPEMAAVVHHGGAGTTAESLRAGAPTLVCPFFGDQPFWGDRVSDLGVGPAPVPIKKLTVETLAAGIRQAVNDPRIRENAAKLGRVLHAEDGVARACEALDVLQP